MVRRNKTFCEIQETYLFVEIARRKKDFIQRNPEAKIISLGVGDTTEPLHDVVINGIAEKLKGLHTVEGYTGYGQFNGSTELRKAISKVIYNSVIDEDEIFISDGSKPDLARMQFLFPPDTTVAVQDPVYPVYVDASVISGKGGEFCGLSGRYNRIIYLECKPDNDFFPNLEIASKADLIYFCSPNNPTGVAATREQLQILVNFAKANNIIIIYDAAYSQFIRDTVKYPKSIFEIDGARQVAIETNSFSKNLGYTGVRLGWTAVPRDVYFDDGTPLIKDWVRIMGTFFNGPPNLSEAGAIAALEVGLECIIDVTDYYLVNVKIIKDALNKTRMSYYGGDSSPYVWVEIPKGGSSWDIFQDLLDYSHVVVTPGEGFGKGGECFFRISSFAHRMDVVEAMKRIVKHFGVSSSVDQNVSPASSRLCDVISG